ncbi:MAG TPA: YsnF/AvaK domain-containing protein [Chloroflexia bacterium]
MQTNECRPGMAVECLGHRLGTLSGVEGTGAAQMLAIRPDKGHTNEPLLQIPGRYIAQVLDNTVLLNITCEEATEIGRGATPAAVPASPDVETTPAAPIVTDIAPGEPLTVPLVEETLVPVTQWHEAGALEVHKTVQTVTQELDVPVRYEEATVERVPLNRVLADDEQPAQRQEGDTLIVPVVREELVVVKQRILVEELRITKQTRTVTRHFAEPVRREEVTFSHEGLEAQPTESVPAPPEQ